MEAKLIAILPDGTVTTTPLDKAPTLEQLKAVVDGYIEHVPYFAQYEGQDCVAFCNEHGKLNGMAYNPTATKIWHTQTGRLLEDVLMGPIAVVVGPQSMLRNM